MAWLSEDLMKWVEDKIPLVLVCVFLLLLGRIISFQPSMFIKRHGRKHALTGLAYLVWISWGFFDLLAPQLRSWSLPGVVYDTGLGLLGIVLTVSAALEFKHKNVKNFASGTLDEHATVTYNEMIEHSFYQGVNLVQIIFLHSFHYFHKLGDLQRLGLLMAVTSPWLMRSWFPVNKFSDNYASVDEKSSALIRILYRIKKYQYVFYKHFVLHGLNITVAVLNLDIATKRTFRLFWLMLNLSYVMEFFLQTLVKKQYLTQNNMLWLQKLLMTAASLSSISVLQEVSIPAALASLVLNFTNRKHDFLNTVIVAVGYMLYLRR